MDLTSFSCALFIAGAFVFHWSMARWGVRWQNLVLLVSGAVFYGLVDLRFLWLVIASAGVNYFLAISLADAPNERRRTWFLRAGLVLNLGSLWYFKYFSFFRAGFADLFQHFGFNTSGPALAIALPLGISFYTFQMLGYLIDVHNEEVEPCREPLKFLTYMLYFPKVMSGPIERAQRFIPQLDTERTFDAALATDGMRQILWGLFAKVVLADNAGRFVDVIFQHPGSEAGSTLAVGAFLYILQIYCDFSGYSNMALGISKLFGIRLMVNFATPFFATNIGEFWRRWHISLTTWMVDHVFTPLSFLLRSRGRAGTILAISATYMAVAIWHNAQWTYVVFGLLQTVYFLPIIFANSVNRPSAFNERSLLPSVGQLVRMLGMFTLMTLTFVLLRVKDLGEAGTYYLGLLKPSLLSAPTVFPTNVFCIAPLFILAEWVQRSRTHALEGIGANMTIGLRWSLYAILLFAVILLNGTGTYRFIYFQF